jgi:hypothetical protein
MSFSSREKWQEKRARKEAWRQERWAAKQALRSEKSPGGFGSVLRGAGLFMILGLAAIAFFSSGDDHGGKTSTAASNDPDPGNTLHDLVRDKKFLAESPDFLNITRRLIAANGFQCPRVNIMWPKGPSPYGSKFEVFCGPDSGSGIYEAQHYAVYPTQFRVDVCKSNGLFSNGCD